MRKLTASGFIIDAEEFLKAAELLLNQSAHISLPVFFLFGRALELSLKAYLLHTGVNGQAPRLKAYGHDLSKLLIAANEQGLAQYVDLNQMEFGAIEVLREEYFSTRLSYRDTDGTYVLPRIDLIESATRKMAIGVSNFVSGVGFAGEQSWAN